MRTRRGLETTRAAWRLAQEKGQRGSGRRTAWWRSTVYGRRTQEEARQISTVDEALRREGASAEVKRGSAEGGAAARMEVGGGGGGERGWALGWIFLGEAAGKLGGEWGSA